MSAARNGSYASSRRITSAITGHERESNHFAPARMSAPCASHCYAALVQGLDCGYQLASELSSVLWIAIGIEYIHP